MVGSASTTTPVERQSYVDIAGQGDGGARRRRGFTITMTALLAGLVISVVAQFTPSVLPGLHAAYRSIWPQGWTFFTGLATRVSVVGYTITGDGRELTPITQRRSLADRSLGLSRTGEAAAFDIGQIAQAVPSAYWQTCATSNPGACGAHLGLARAYTVSSAAGLRSVCGRIAVATETEEPRRVLRMAIVDVTCER
jgi:hypothetical protein